MWTIQPHVSSCDDQQYIQFHSGEKCIVQLKYTCKGHNKKSLLLKQTKAGSYWPKVRRLEAGAFAYYTYPFYINYFVRVTLDLYTENEGRGYVALK